MTFLDVNVHRNHKKPQTFINHLSKFLIVSRKPKLEKTCRQVLNFDHSYEKDQKVIFRSFFRTKNVTIFRTFNDSKHENLSQIFFPDKTKNLEGFPLKVVFGAAEELFQFQYKANPWINHVKIIAESLKMKLTMKKLPVNLNWKKYEYYLFDVYKAYKSLISADQMDIHMNAFSKPNYSHLNCYREVEGCFWIPLPPEHAFYEQVLFLPLDQSCWIW